MITVRLYVEPDDQISAKLLGDDKAPVVTLYIGELGIIVPQSSQARAIASALTTAADALDEKMALVGR